VKRSEENAYREYVTARMETMRRTAYLLCRDWHTADDLVSITISKLYRHWARVGGTPGIDAYVRKALLRTWLDEKRRPWRRAEQRDGELPDAADATSDPDTTSAKLWARELVHTALLQVPPRQRAVLVLRYFEDLAVAEVAVAMGCTEGTVKSQTARGLATLRAIVEKLDSSSGRVAS